MTASGKLSPDALQCLGLALDELSQITMRFRVRFDAYMPMYAEVDDVVLRITWDDDMNRYVVDRRFDD